MEKPPLERVVEHIEKNAAIREYAENLEIFQFLRHTEFLWKHTLNGEERTLVVDILQEKILDDHPESERMLEIAEKLSKLPPWQEIPDSGKKT